MEQVTAELRRLENFHSTFLGKEYCGNRRDRGPDGYVRLKERQESMRRGFKMGVECLASLLRERVEDKLIPLADPHLLEVDDGRALLASLRQLRGELSGRIA